MPNVKLLQDTLAYIEAHPEEWDQFVFRETTDCGTAMCFAGWAITLDGGTWSDDDLVNAREDDPPDHVYQDDDYGLRVLTRARAARILGLTEPQSLDLFFYQNTMDDLRRIVAELIAEGTDVES